MAAEEVHTKKKKNEPARAADSPMAIDRESVPGPTGQTGQRVRTLCEHHI